MRGRVFVLFLLLALPMTGFGQSTLNFPKFFSAAELPNSGFAIVNPGPTTANVTFTLYGAGGNVVSTSTATTEPPLAGGSQRALSGDQIFPTLGTGGWVQATSTTSGLQGFWLNYNGSLTYLDGAESATPAVKLTIPLVAGSTDLDIANPNPTGTAVSIELHGFDGSQLATAVPETLSANGVFHSDVFTLFNVTAPTTACYVRVLSGSTNALLATAVVKNYLVPVEDGVINGVDESSTAIQLNIPHVVSGPLGGPNYTTVVGVTNLSNTPQTVTVTLSVSGSPSIPVQVQLAGRGTMSDTAQHLFNLPASTFENGWIQISGTSPITGFAAYADLVGGAFTIVPAKSVGSTNLVFAHIANLPPWQTGIALLNPGTTAATVQVSAMTPAGTLIGGATTDPSTATLTIPPGTKTALGLSQLIPEAAVQSATHPADGGFVFIQSTNNVPIYGIELFYNNNVTILSNVAGNQLATGIQFVPPAPTLPLTLASISPTKVATGGTVTLAGTGFSTTGSNDVVTFTTATGTTTATVSTATTTSLALVIPSTAISGPVTVTTGGVTSSSVILEVLATPSTVAQNSVSITANGGTTTGVDIYVDPPAAAAANVLNATQIGIGAVPAAGQSLSVSIYQVSATVTHGTQVEVLIYGTGIGSTLGTTLSFSGTGITVSGVQYDPSGQNQYMFATLTISATATLGARNVILTNANLDVSILAGGLIIQ